MATDTFTCIYHPICKISLIDAQILVYLKIRSCVICECCLGIHKGISYLNKFI